MISEAPDSWATSQEILVILAHPDDPEFFCGATLARWARAGHIIRYCLLTCGDKGRNAHNEHIAAEELCALRHEEQRAAARVIGAKEVHFLDFQDGYLVPDLNLRRAIVRQIRRFRPSILVTCDPLNLYPSTAYGLNHPDHRAAGQAVLDAVFPAAGNPLYFPELLEEGLQPHTPREVWISLTAQPNVALDVTETWPIKIQAILEHKSQIGDPQALLERLKKWRTEDSTDDAPRYEERFRRLIFG
uniref:LmbE family protein n=1 Tax=uncultured Chloroflexota bacterium TaxID=166587 RepID=H5SF31_9CHLR|nr:LmbE family protein [uncultured Chloroflexota bacterium]